MLRLGGSLMVSWGRGVPDWRRLAIDPLRVPGIQALLMESGVDRVTVDDLPGLDWECCGLYKVVVNEGGLYSEEPLEPLHSITADFAVFNPVRCPLRGVQATDSFVNPLGWTPYTPFINKPAQSCISIEGASIGLVRAEPLQAWLPEPCVRAPRRGPHSRLSLGRARLGIEGVLYSYGQLNAITGPWGVGGVTGTAATLLTRGDGLVLEPGSYDYEVYMLYPLHYRMVDRVRRGDRLELQALSLVIRGGGPALGISSPSGVKASMRPGRIEVEASGILTVTLGGESIAYRALIEQAMEPARGPVPGSGIGHIRSGPGAPVLVDLCDNRISILVQNPSLVDGIFEARVRFPVKRAEVHTPLGRQDVYTRDGLVRLPMPRGFIGLLVVEIDTSILGRLRLRKGGPGRLTQPV
ncbi:MAG: hypothetical protein GSR86_00940 [Desulfurococcales archaeon]|nr:hypothetical protein [Desulfurococcales archaeon]